MAQLYRQQQRSSTRFFHVEGTIPGLEENGARNGPRPKRPKFGLCERSDANSVQSGALPEIVGTRVWRISVEGAGHSAVFFTALIFSVHFGSSQNGHPQWRDGMPDEK
jgi:hypothetical protein